MKLSVESDSDGASGLTIRSASGYLEYEMKLNSAVWSEPEDDEQDNWSLNTFPFAEFHSELWRDPEDDRHFFRREGKTILSSTRKLGRRIAMEEREGTLRSGCASENGK